MTSADSKLSQLGNYGWWKPLLLVPTLGLLALFFVGLGRDSTFMPSALIGHQVPQFHLKALSGESSIRAADLVGKPLIINFWASWCGACRNEHETLLKLGQQLNANGQARILGINHRDTQANAERFLSRLGRFPYHSGIDQNGRLGVDFGVFGLPETFFVDADGIVRARHIGPLRPRDLPRHLARIGVAQ